MNIDEFLNAWFLSSLIYRIRKTDDFEGFEALVEEHLGMSCHVSSFGNGAQLCGVAHEKGFRSTLYKFERGTGGFNGWANFESWLTDLNMSTGDDFQHDGFQEYGNRSFDTFKSYIENAQAIIQCGHSQGAGVSQRLVWLYCKLKKDDKLGGLEKVRYYLFASPPHGKKAFSDEIASYEKEGLCSGYRFIMPGDPIASEKLRLPPFNGTDIGKAVVLPQVIQEEYREKLGPGNFVNHSCLLQTMAMFPYLISIGANLSQLKRLSDIMRLIIN
jgi:hypothetical protein